jgi:WD40 repeat protein
VGKVVVVYFPKLNMQRYYKGHTQPISVIEISKLNRLAASAESGEYPAIHVWDMESRLNLIKFKRIHKYSIKFLKFFRNDRYLITASESLKFGGSIESPIIVLKLDTKEVIMSTYLTEEIIGISEVLNETEKEASTLLLGKSRITVLTQNNRAFSVQKYE